MNGKQAPNQDSTNGRGGGGAGVKPQMYWTGRTPPENKINKINKINK